MLGVVKLSDNGGITVPPGALAASPVLGTGQSATDAATGGDHTLTLTAGKTYLVTVDATGNFIFGVAAVTTAANVAWMCPAGHAVVIHMPIEYATLHYECLTSGGTLYLVELQQ